MQRRAAVAGVGESEYYKRGGSPQSEFQLACLAIRRAVEDAGLELSEVDGFVSYSDPRNDPVRLSAALGVSRVEFTAQTWGGGGNGVGSAVALADMAISAGYARHVVVFRALAQGQYGRFGQAAFGVQRGSRGVGGSTAFTAPYGLLTAAQVNAMQTTRFMHEHGVTQSSLFEIAWISYDCAQRNPRALRRGMPLTREAYDESRWIAEPFHLFDCCPENDGAAAVVVTSLERARDLRRGAVPILAAAQGLEYRGGVGAFNEAPFPTAHFRHCGESLWRNAGVGPEDVDVAQFYENFTGPVLMAITEMGFCRARRARQVGHLRRAALAGRRAADQHQRRQHRRGVHPRLRARERGGAPDPRRVHQPGARRGALAGGRGSRLRAGQRRALLQGLKKCS